MLKAAQQYEDAIDIYKLLMPVYEAQELYFDQVFFSFF
jgi:hypothetical protein